MKRTPLTRKTALARKAPLRSTSQRVAGSEGQTRGIGRTAGLSREKGLERAAPKAARAQRAPRRWTAAKLDYCEACYRTKAAVGRGGLRLVQHHVFYAQHVEAQGADPWDPRDSLTVCDGPGSCHADHHGRSRLIRLVDLPDSVFEFGREVFGGPAAYEYLARRYGIADLHGTDPRLDALLAEA